MIKRYVWKINQLGSMVLPRLRVSGDNGDCGGRYLDIKDKMALGICKNRYAGVV